MTPAVAILRAWVHCCRHKGDPALPLHVRKELQPQQETLDGSMQALTLWQHKLMQAVIAQAEAKLSALVTAWSGGVAVSQQWPHQLLPGEVL